MAFDPKHLPEDPKILQQMVLDLMAQLDRESTERTKIETLLHELLDSKRNRKSEQLSGDQLALFAAAWQEQHPDAAAESKDTATDKNDDNDGTGTGHTTTGKTGGRKPLAAHLKRERIVHDLAESQKHCNCCGKDLHLVGEETSERYEFIPAVMKVIEDVRLQYACDGT